MTSKTYADMRKLREGGTRTKSSSAEKKRAMKWWKETLPAVSEKHNNDTALWSFLVFIGVKMLDYLGVFFFFFIGGKLSPNHPCS